VVKAASKNYHLKKSWLLTYYPYVTYSINPMVTAESSIDMMADSSFYQSLRSVRKDVLLYGDDYYGYERSVSQILVCAGFAFRSVLFRDDVMFRDRSLPPCVGFEPITGWSNRKKHPRVVRSRGSKYPEMVVKRVDVGIGNFERREALPEDFDADSLKWLRDDVSSCDDNWRHGSNQEQTPQMIWGDEWRSGWLSVGPGGTTVVDTQWQRAQVLRAMAEMLHSVRKHQMDGVDE